MHTIRSSLTLLVVACVVPASVVSALLVSYEYRREHGRLVRDSVATARAMVQAVDRDLSAISLAAEILASSPDLRTGDLRAFLAFATQTVPRRIGNNVVLSDVTGTQLVNTLRPFGEPLPSHGNVEQLRTVFQTGRPVMSNVYIGAVLRRPVMSYDVPVFRDGKVVYDLSLGILPEHFLALLTDQHLPSDWISAIFDSSGAIVSRTHEMQRFLGKRGSGALVRRMGEVNEDAFESSTLEGIPVLTVFSRSPVSRWTVAIGIPTKSLTAALRRSLLRLVLGMVVLLLSGLAVAWVVGGQISRSIRGLCRPALALGYGQVVTLPRLSLREADEVGRALVSASKTLQEAQHLARHDPLTGLANRAMFNELVDHHVSVCSRTQDPFAVLYVDLDGFKAVNDTYGHVVGDELLRTVATRLRNATRSSDVVARLGGDEFGIALIKTGTSAARTVAGNLTRALSAPYLVGHSSIEISASVGLAGYPDSGRTTTALVHSADEMMYRAKLDQKPRGPAEHSASE